MSLPSVEMSTTVQTVSVTNTSAAVTNPFSDSTTHVRLVCTVDCHILFGTSPTATTAKTYLPADHVEYFKVTDAANTKIAAIRAGSNDGTLYVSEF